MKLVFLCLTIMTITALNAKKVTRSSTNKVIEVKADFKKQDISLAKKKLFRKQLEEKNKRLVKRQIQLIRLNNEMTLSKKIEKGLTENKKSSKI